MCEAQIARWCTNADAYTRMSLFAKASRSRRWVSPRPSTPATTHRTTGSIRACRPVRPRGHTVPTFPELVPRRGVQGALVNPSVQQIALSGCSAIFPPRSSRSSIRRPCAPTSFKRREDRVRGTLRRLKVVRCCTKNGCEFSGTIRRAHTGLAAPSHRLSVLVLTLTPNISIARRKLHV